MASESNRTSRLVSEILVSRRRAVMGMSANYPARYAEALGLQLGDEESDIVLDLARVVAHGSERRFAPLSSYLAGQFVAELVRAGIPRDEALKEALSLAERSLATDPVKED